MTYHPSWEAIIKDVGRRVRIFLAGPNTMLVFPEREAPLKIIFRYGKTVDVIVGEVVSISFYIMLIMYFILRGIFKLKSPSKKMLIRIVDHL